MTRFGGSFGIKSFAVFWFCFVFFLIQYIPVLNLRNSREGRPRERAFRLCLPGQERGHTQSSSDGNQVYGTGTSIPCIPPFHYSKKRQGATKEGKELS